MQSETIVDIFERRVNESGARPAQRFRVDGGWERRSWREWWEISERFAAGLLDLGVEAGDRVAILSQTRVEWAWVDLAVAMIGAVTVPVYPTQLPETTGYVLGHATPRVIVAEDPAQIESLLSVREQLGSVEHVVHFDATVVFDAPDERGRRELVLDDLELPAGWSHSLEEVAAKGRRRLAADGRVVAARRRLVRPGQTATIVYTSGTQGRPKGVELTHGNLAAEVRALLALELLDSDDVQLLSLPLAHIFARVLLFAGIGHGVETAFGESWATIFRDLGEIEPTFFATVPQVLERVRARIEARGRVGGGFQARLFSRAAEVGRRISRQARGGEPAGLADRAMHALLDPVIHAPVRELFGGRLRFLVSGGAPLGAELAEFFHALGVLVLEGYGMTEATAVAAVNLPDEFRFGSVGRALPGVEVTIDEDGEVLLRGPSVMKGYYRDPEATAEAFDARGWLRTGDLGIFDRDGFLRITGRKKELIITSGGKNIAPMRLEGMLCASPLVDHAMVYGDRRSYLTALISIQESSLRAWAEEEGVEVPEDPMALTQDLRLHRAVQAHVDSVNASLARFEAIRKFAIVERPFSQEAGELTPTEKLRRAAIADNRMALLDSFYAEAY